MKKKQISPVLIIAFNRPNTTEKLINAIRKVKPKSIFISVDGPRNDKEKIKIEEVKEVFSKIDWPCKIRKRFLKENHGIIGGAIGAIHWFFDNVEEGIIFDDDCIPTPNFFKFCIKMLEKYRDDERIMHICGYNFQRGWKRDKYSYYFSRYTYMWGWATWRRAWKKYDVDMKEYPNLKKKRYIDFLFNSKIEKNYIKHLFDTAYKNPKAVDTKWLYSVIINNGLTIVPNKNLIKNVGFQNSSSTNTKNIDAYLSHPTKKLKFPLKHPPFIIRDTVSDKRYAKWLFKNRIKKQLLLRTGLHRLMH